ncbi:MULTISPECIES: ectoine/hydroxyectoine ABC transporter substrate-binding protein EhuB [Streptomyces]|uniref:Ectoine/hydroxyectoine ABC transporter substrate-binding protein EhuB n=2 Tax=Streptomyces griseoaurantiacus TaxID=68213 RepID=A0ABZ1V7T9_9ACTN|nr:MULTISPECIES: ectoine/hydroxyectoine ABC transporter substrate-binding protein EhuB [Streptomyces]MBA5222990.1 ectoine/hydroxyectoine ABC transporter substrate-binding protein EhuB [Streptomyces griseoaurantiacus]MDX3360739.1 ectoine/hydroxyectoine ABC transporter substrate-binding protein EhuB [Streptomyces sp. ME02-6978.2a]NJP70615.1 ectoine/hydroxyectoine ABC transporter substrate-binding protein EhuB [Streptomyces sp. C1-2]
MASPPVHGAHIPRPSRRALLAGAAGLLVPVAAGCSRVATASTSDGGDLLDRLRAQGVARLGIAGEIPFGYIDKNGDLTGEAPELAKVIFKRLGVDRVQAVPTEFGSLIPGLNSQQFDIVSAGMYINPDRCEQVIFSDPDYQMLDSFVVRKGNPLGLHNYQDVVKKKAKFATGTGYAEIAYAVEAGYEESDILIVPDQVAGMNAVEAGRADVFAATAVTARQVVLKSRKAEATEAFKPLVDGKPHVDGGGFAFRPTETKLRDAFNAELRKLRESGELLRIIKPFGFTQDEVTDMTAKELCGQ